LHKAIFKRDFKKIWKQIRKSETVCIQIDKWCIQNEGPSWEKRCKEMVQKGPKAPLFHNNWDGYYNRYYSFFILNRSYGLFSFFREKNEGFFFFCLFRLENMIFFGCHSSYLPFQLLAHLQSKGWFILEHCFSKP
jgi:hypothetical protein